jgi:hypothetical protein
MRAGKQDMLKSWLEMMDVHQSQALYTVIAHEIARFASVDDKVLSHVGRSLPPITITDSASEREKRAALRFYRVMERLGFKSPDMPESLRTIAESQEAVDASAIQRFGQSGSVAGVVFSALTLQGAKGLDALPDSTVVSIVDALQSCGYHILAKRFALESVLAFF